MLLRPLSRALARVAADASGQIAMLAGLVLPPIIILGGIAVDYHLALTSKEQVQSAMDSAVVAGARALQKGSSPDQIRTDVRGYFNAMIQDEAHGLTCDPVQVFFPTGTNDVRATVDCVQTTAILKLVEADDVPIGVEASATFGINKLDIAFVFDVSGSMSDSGKIADLRTAANAAIAELLPAATSPRHGDVRIAIAPYDHQINVGPYFTAMTNEQAARTWPAETRRTERYCRRFRRNGSCRRWGTRFALDENGDYIWDPVDYDVTNTCIYERAGAQAFTDAPPGAGDWFGSGEREWFFDASENARVNGDNGNRVYEVGAYRAPSWTSVNGTYDSCSDSEITPLTANRTTLETAIRDLSTNFATNGSLGFAMGWYLISPQWSSVWPTGSVPLPATDPNARKVIIMMTDGEFNTWRTDQTTYGDGWARMTTLCNAAKAERVIVYTIAFDLSDTTAINVLTDCASTPENFHNPVSGSDLTDAYADIARSISDLRLNQ